MSTIEDGVRPVQGGAVVASVRAALWHGGWPIRFALLSLVRGYRLTLGRVVGGRCRFHPSCSAYAETAIAELGVTRGLALTVWRILRCSPLTRGGVDQPPTRHRAAEYDGVIHRRPGGGGSGRPEVAA